MLVKQLASATAVAVFEAGRAHACHLRRNPAGGTVVGTEPRMFNHNLPSVITPLMTWTMAFGSLIAITRVVVVLPLGVSPANIRFSTAGVHRSKQARGRILGALVHDTFAGNRLGTACGCGGCRVVASEHADMTTSERMD